MATKLALNAKTLRVSDKAPEPMHGKLQLLIVEEPAENAGRGFGILNESMNKAIAQGDTILHVERLPGSGLNMVRLLFLVRRK